MDQRDLNYDKYFSNGEEESKDKEYNSHNTKQLSVAEIKEKIIGLFEVKEELDYFKIK